MSKETSFLSAAEENQVVEAIRKAEQLTSGEIRVHLEHLEFDGGQVPQRAATVFHQLKMNNTQMRNGVLIYVAVNLKQFYIYGDQGIHAKVGEGFWNHTKNVILEAFKQAKFAYGLSMGILEIGKALANYFPILHGKDINELPNEISKS